MDGGGGKGRGEERRERLSKEKISGHAGTYQCILIRFLSPPMHPHLHYPVQCHVESEQSLVQEVVIGGTGSSGLSRWEPYGDVFVWRGVVWRGPQGILWYGRTSNLVATLVSCEEEGAEAERGPPQPGRNWTAGNERIGVSERA